MSSKGLHPPENQQAVLPVSNEAFRPSRDRPVIKLSVKLIETYKHINKVIDSLKSKNT